MFRNMFLKNVEYEFHIAENMFNFNWAHKKCANIWDLYGFVLSLMFCDSLACGSKIWKSCGLG